MRVTQPPSPSARDMDSAISGSPALVVPILPLADFLQPVGGPIRAQQMQLVADAIPRHWRLRSRTRLMFGRTRVRPPQATPAAPPRGLNAAPAGLSRPCGSLKLMTGAQRQVHETFTSFLSCPPQVYPARGDVLAGARCPPNSRSICLCLLHFCLGASVLHAPMHALRLWVLGFAAYATAYRRSRE